MVGIVLLMTTMETTMVCLRSREVTNCGELERVLDDVENGRNRECPGIGGEYLVTDMLY